MRILPVTIANPESDVIKEAVTCLRDGGVIIYPTDTCYGIGCIGGNPGIFKKIFELKQRSGDLALSMIFSSVDDIAKYALVDDQTRTVLEEYLPGAYSFLLINTDFKLKRSNELVARIPDFPLTKMIAEGLGYPYTSTSANITGHPPAYSLEELDQGVLNYDTLTVIPDLILDGGLLPLNPTSTIVDLKAWPPKIIRQGSGIFAIPAATE